MSNTPTILTKDIADRASSGQPITAEEMAVIVTHLRGDRAKAVDLSAIKKEATRGKGKKKAAAASSLLADFEAQMKEQE